MTVLQIYITRNYCYQIVITDKSITVIPTTEIGLFKVQSDCIVFIDLAQRKFAMYSY